MLATKHMIDTVTVWVAHDSYDPNNPYNNQKTWANRKLKCEYESGGRTQVDSTGAEFRPATTVYTVEVIERGSMIKIGSHDDAEPPKDAELVRKSGGGTSLSFQMREYVAWTG